MWWIRELDSEIDESHPWSTTELEFSSDSHVGGVIEYADHRIVCQMSTFEPDATGQRRYTLVLARPPFDAGEYLAGDATSDGYFFRGGPGAELVAIFSFFLQCRFFVISIVSERAAGNTVPLRHYFDTRPTSSGRAFEEAFTIKRNFAIGLSDFLDQLRRAPSEYHPSLALALFNYSEALRLLGSDEELAFVRLVSAVESISASFKLDKADDCFKGKDFDEYVRGDRLSEDQDRELRNIFNMRKSRLKFVRFMQKYCASCLPETDDRPQHVALTRPRLEDTLNAVYSARSAYLHRCQPMYLSRPLVDHPDWDFSPDIGMQYDKRLFLPETKLPYGYVFQRLVRTAILGYIAELTARGKAET